MHTSHSAAKYTYIQLCYPQRFTFQEYFNWRGLYSVNGLDVSIVIFTAFWILDLDEEGE